MGKLSKHPREPSQLAKLIADIATRDGPGKTPAPKKRRLYKKMIAA
jgi:hypothetical protein